MDVWLFVLIFTCVIANGTPHTTVIASGTKQSTHRYRHCEQSEAICLFSTPNQQIASLLAVVRNDG
jgi:hypothetical protein